MLDRAICSIDGCGNPQRARGWCNRHYKRWHQHGDPTTVLVPMPAHGDPARFIEFAAAYEGDDCLVWPFHRRSDGYASIRIDGQATNAHREVCALVHGPAPTPEHEAAHSCGKGHEGCVNGRHLRWATPAENKADQRIHGTIARGERHGRAKLSEADVRQILAMKGEKSPRQIAAMFSISRTTVSNILNGWRWGWLA